MVAAREMLVKGLVWDRLYGVLNKTVCLSPRTERATTKLTCRYLDCY